MEAWGGASLNEVLNSYGATEVRESGRPPRASQNQTSGPSRNLGSQGSGRGATNQ